MLLFDPRRHTPHLTSSKRCDSDCTTFFPNLIFYLLFGTTHIWYNKNRCNFDCIIFPQRLTSWKKCNFDHTIFPQISVLDCILSLHLPYLTTLCPPSCCIQLYHIRPLFCEGSVVGIILFITHNVCKQTVHCFTCIIGPA